VVIVEQFGNFVVIGNTWSRTILQSLYFGVIEQLQDAKVPVPFVLKVPNDDCGSAGRVSVIDVLKYLIEQAIRVSQDGQTEKSMSLTYANISEASTEKEWLQILGRILGELDGQVCIIFDVRVPNRRLEDSSSFSWILAFEKIYRNLAAQRCEIILRVLLVSYGSLSFKVSDNQRKFVVTAKTQAVTARQRKNGLVMPVSKKSL
jgi:hypothetical protein